MVSHWATRLHIDPKRRDADRILPVRLSDLVGENLDPTILALGALAAKHVVTGETAVRLAIRHMRQQTHHASHTHPTSEGM
jgi:FixJ family two-component response regulator